MPSAPTIRADELSFSYGQRRALDNVTFAVEPGRLVGLLGPNGSGKSTLFRILITLVPPQSGRAAILGFDCAVQADHVRAAIGVVFQSPAIDRRLTVAENLRHHGRLYDLHGRDLECRITEQLDRAGLADRAADLVETLSGGQRRRAELAKALLHRPAVLLLDEPSTGLDPAARRAFRAELRRLRDELGLTALLTTHFMEEADECDELLLIDAGRIVARGAPDELKRRLGGDCLVIAAVDADGLAPQIAAHFNVQPQIVDGTLRVESPSAQDLIAPIHAAFRAQIHSITLARPTLEDVFIHHTGRRLENAA